MFCQGKTTKGTSCTRKVTDRNIYCWQHGNSKVTKLNIAENRNIFILLDDIILNWIISRLDIKDLTMFSRVNKKGQILCKNKIFWTNRFKLLPFFYDIPDNSGKIINEYRRICECRDLSHIYFNKFITFIKEDSYMNGLFHFTITKRGKAAVKWFHLNVATEIENYDAYEKINGKITSISSIRFEFFGHADTKYKIDLKIRSKNNIITLSLSDQYAKYIFIQALYHIENAKFGVFINTTKAFCCESDKDKLEIFRIIDGLDI